MGRGGTTSGRPEDEPPEHGRDRIRRACAAVSAALVAGLAGLHAYWAVGGAWGATVGSDGALNPEESLPLGSRPVTWVMDFADATSWTRFLFGPVAAVLFILTLVVALPARTGRRMTGRGRAAGGRRDF